MDLELPFMTFKVSVRQYGEGEENLGEQLFCCTSDGGETWVNCGNNFFSFMLNTYLRYEEIQSYPEQVEGIDYLVKIYELTNEEPQQQ